MACPKKKTSNGKRDQRRAANWRRQAAVEAQKALSLGKSVLSGRSNSFVYPKAEEESDDAE